MDFKGDFVSKIIEIFQHLICGIIERAIGDDELAAEHESRGSPASKYYELHKVTMTFDERCQLECFEALLLELVVM